MTSPANSRRVVITGKGGPEALALVAGPAPEPRRGQVRIAVAVAGVAFGDVVRRRGLLAPRAPFTPGYDVAGTVDAVGADADAALLGQRVAALMPGPGLGGYAEHVCVSAARLVPIPDEIDVADAVCLGLNYITAFQILKRVARLREGQRLLVHGAAGGVGTALLDLGRLQKLEMYGTASPGKHELVRQRGATPIDYRSEDFVARIAALSGDGVDAVCDPIGGAHLRRSYRTLRRGGTLVSYGVSGDLSRGWRGVAGGLGIVAALKLRLDGRRVRLYGIGATPGTGWRQCRDDWAELLELCRRGLITPLIGARIPLAEARRAHELIDAAAVSGKIVLTCN
jgi:NADPH:quinone reductase-like Zn-dependent oxidoreductase